MDALVCQYIITLPKAQKIFALFKQKKHSAKGYYFEMEELGDDERLIRRNYGHEFYSSKSPVGSVYFLLKVFREVDK